VELIRITDLYKTYHVGEQDVPVLKGVSMAVEEGELISLTGASGSGKSTLMNILGCLDRPSSGTYVLGGEDVSRLTPDERARVRGRKIGFVFQSFNLLSRTTALDNVLMPLSYAHPRVPDREARDRAESLLERVGLGDRMHHYPNQLSGGQMQRVAIARSLVNEPPLLLADEPTGNLDTQSAQSVFELLREVNREEGMAVLFVTHNLDLARRCDRIVHVVDGRLRQPVGLNGRQGAST